MQMSIQDVWLYLDHQQASQATMTGTLLSRQDVAVSHFAEPPSHRTEAVDYGLTLVRS